MLKLFKKAFWILCEDITVCPSIANMHLAIAKYCENNGYAYHFTDDNEVVIAESHMRSSVFVPFFIEDVMSLSAGRNNASLSCKFQFID